MGIEDKTLLCFCHWGRINKVLSDGLISYKGGTTDHVINKMLYFTVKFDRSELIQLIDTLLQFNDGYASSSLEKEMCLTCNIRHMYQVKCSTPFITPKQSQPGVQNIPLKAWLEQRNLLNQGTSRMTAGSTGFPCTQTGSQQTKQSVELSESDDTSISVEIENGNNW
ncbi:hypothetical protein R3W88_033887 [Solanum pinnatisectum]|uniref:Uncharacterized protein n=1 Tax=Solanum pinnatisectum TaxID=50273 RepID=A0AAV9K048_9SOLN|nr:hypothetical protein R3W88_033887 [Solanum pinnatisectum]